MTLTSFIVAKVASAFGLNLSEKHRTAAAFEAHLLRDAESIVGSLTWQNLESLEGLSTEYWLLRKLSSKHSELSKKVDELTEILESSQEARTQAIEEISEKSRAITTERDQTATKIERLHQEREDIQRDGRAVKRSHAGLKTKLEVLLEEDDEENQRGIEATNASLKELRSKFDAIKERRDEIDTLINELQKKLNVLNREISEENRIIREKAESQFSTIGKTNKELTKLKSEQGAMETESERLYSQVGAFILANPDDPEVKNATKEYRGLLNIIKAIRASANRHRKLFDN